MATRERTESTVHSYKTTLAKNVPLEYWQRKIETLKREDIQNLVFNPNLNIAPKTRQNLLQYLSKVFSDAYAHGYISHNPCLGIKVKVPESQLEAWTLSEVNYLLACAAKEYHPWFCHWALAVLSGLRNGELYALEWKNVDFENRRIHVVSNWTAKDEYHETKSRKNRVVTMNPALATLLMQLKLVRGSEKFVLPHYNAWTKGEQAKALRNFAKSIDLRPVNFHSLRASFITICLLQGVPVGKVQYLVGHVRLETTMRYVRVVGADLDGALDDIGIQLPKLQVGNLPQPVLPKHVPVKRRLEIPPVDLQQIFFLKRGENESVA